MSLAPLCSMAMEIEIIYIEVAGSTMKRMRVNPSSLYEVPYKYRPGVLRAVRRDRPLQRSQMFSPVAKLSTSIGVLGEVVIIDVTLLAVTSPDNMLWVEKTPRWTQTIQQNERQPIEEGEKWESAPLRQYMCRYILSSTPMAQAIRVIRFSRLRSVLSHVVLTGSETPRIRVTLRLDVGVYPRQYRVVKAQARKGSGSRHRNDKVALEYAPSNKDINAVDEAYKDPHPHDLCSGVVD
ncbi:hypothetical protein IW262DRAFT_1292982 [Armillaria fumosa]|nr:hypothetical protein IW262DRAFT_1292982 [Armillaria fumosa]